MLWLFCGFLVLSAATAARFSTVIIDAGHGGKDKGAYWGGVRESTLNLGVARELEACLKKRGIRTVMTRRSDVFISLRGRANIANRYRNAVFVSIHFNASRNTRICGAETYYWGNQGRVLAGAIQRRLPARLKTYNRGIRKRGLAVLVHTRCPAVLVECGFMSNRNERQRCATRWYQQTAARGIYDALMAYR
ncbi:N-acetylmuramoyl-L-alanine amidase family protein [Haloferula sargassicola]|uniref:N-acetylmuramoyl-L-alanine amidase family protein n=1 Tax=Haloferula sargassicola TaxID=490096 RepID=UPI003365A85E